MVSEKVSCLGLTGPYPVLRVKELVDRGDVAMLRVLVDNPVARENVSRLLGRMGYEVDIGEQHGVFEIVGMRPDLVMGQAPAVERGEGGPHGTVIIIGTDRMGHGNDELGHKLLHQFIMEVDAMGPDLRRMIFLNGGVKLVVDGSSCIDTLRKLEEKGVRLLVCETCLKFFSLEESARIGEPTSMGGIIEAMKTAGRIMNVV